ncbi:MAG: YbaN family protein [Bdellovibrionales bacterium]|nr:YbaN family protein [Bdellovibrionales bacterium]
MTRLAYIGLGYLFFALGFIGAFLPIMPTTPFLILAAGCFSRSSPRLHQWVLDQPTVGPLVRDWECYGIIRTRAKILATGMIAISLFYPLVIKDFSLAIKLSIGGVVAVVLLYIWTRPSESSEVTPKDTD